MGVEKEGVRLGGGGWEGAGGKEKMKVSEEVRGGRTESQPFGFCSRHVWGDWRCASLCLRAAAVCFGGGERFATKVTAEEQTFL